MSEWSKEPASKAGSLEKPGSWVRLPPSPPEFPVCLKLVDRLLLGIGLGLAEKETVMSNDIEKNYEEKLSRATLQPPVKS